MKEWLKNLFGSSDFNHVREPQFAGHQYPDEADDLRRMVEEKLEVEPGEAAADPGTARGLVAPWGDYNFAGGTMGAAWSTVAGRGRPDGIERVVLMGSSKRVPFRGVAIPRHDALRTPLGPVPVDLEALRELAEAEKARLIDPAFEPAANLELQLPFLQVALSGADGVSVVPMLVGDSSQEEVAGVLEAMWTPGTLLVISGNLSEGFEQKQAREHDVETIEAIEQLEADGVQRRHAGARLPLKALIEVVDARGWSIQCRARATSADAGGPAERVVGYGAFVVVE